METPAETDATLRDLPDPELITMWAEARQRLALGTGTRQAYEAAKTEYRRRMGGEA